MFVLCCRGVHSRAPEYWCDHLECSRMCRNLKCDCRFTEFCPIRNGLYVVGCPRSVHVRGFLTEMVVSNKLTYRSVTAGFALGAVVLPVVRGCKIPVPAQVEQKQDSSSEQLKELPGFRSLPGTDCEKSSSPARSLRPVWIGKAQLTCHASECRCFPRVGVLSCQRFVASVRFWR